jgi:hypothetical protein
MSKWFDITRNDLSIDEDKKTVQVLVTRDDDGSIWADIPISYLQDILIDTWPISKDLKETLTKCV